MKTTDRNSLGLGHSSGVSCCRLCTPAASDDGFQTLAERTRFGLSGDN